MLVGLKKAWKNGSTGYSYDYTGKDVRKYYEALNNEPEYPFNANLKTLPEREFHRSFFFSSGIIFAFSENPITVEAAKVLNRFADVFGQTYRRFLDLQKAEAQAKEAQIETALERVRAQTMAMHNSEDVAIAVKTMFDQLTLLGLSPKVRCGIGTFDDSNDMELWTASKDDAGVVLLDIGKIDMRIHPLLKGAKRAWKDKQPFYAYKKLSGKEVTDYFEIINNSPGYTFKTDLKKLPAEIYHYDFIFSQGLVFVFSPHPLTSDFKEIFTRFTKVFQQTYTRYLDLQKAEAQAKNAIKQTSLDRVRGEIASMRSTEDLQRITPLVFKELTTLGVPFIRCGVFIVDEKNKKIDVYLSAPDGQSLGVLHIPYNVNTLTENAVKNWKTKKVYHQHWNKQEFVAWTKSMIAKGQVQNAKTYQGAAQPPDSLDLHFIPFTQGMLYVGNTDQLKEGDIDLVRSLADAFAIAYARYEDFNKLEKAKEDVEQTLSELKTTQTQLVQSEKMASLGELTAGIAHEIQNPLNFVNNFSEVSKELIEEMLEEMQNGDIEEVKALAEDIIQNLEKIHHHGQRADGIVKGMLQHSRTSSGVKEPTDINVLADEYLRLAYHGLRAKDKSFNATLDTHFDETIGKVNVLAQDLGRVILNLITNAFYVVKEKKEQQPESYKPTVTVSTKKTKDGIEISVMDNGNGIPEAIKKKIFQPFFTTKPTGQGTGLGLSMSYDIVTKGHGGELKVETKENEGSAFIIYLPL
jgi:signal transduction histidine kinase